LSADLTLDAAQIYPTTLTTFDVSLQDRPNGVLTIARTGTPTPVLSAGGVLRLAAPTIEQGGVLKAPLGQIELTAEKTLTLADGGLTSTSTEGQVIPFGRTQGGIDWTYPLGDQTLLFDIPPAQRVRLEANAIDVARGSIIDVSGGGDLTAYEFIPGPGGTHDVLDPASGSYAILPGLAPTYAPFDPLESPSAGLTPGDSLIVAAGVPGLPAGTYALLPARYALLPGAFLVTPVAGMQDLVPGETLSRLDGVPIVAARHAVANTNIADSRWSGFRRRDRHRSPHARRVHGEFRQRLLRRAGAVRGHGGAASACGRRHTDLCRRRVARARWRAARRGGKWAGSADARTCRPTASPSSRRKQARKARWSCAPTV
jgi:hypothetical protein